MRSIVKDEIGEERVDGRARQQMEVA